MHTIDFLISRRMRVTCPCRATAECWNLILTQVANIIPLMSLIGHSSDRHRLVFFPLSLDGSWFHAATLVRHSTLFELKINKIDNKTDTQMASRDLAPLESSDFHFYVCLTISFVRRRSPRDASRGVKRGAFVSIVYIYICCWRLHTQKRMEMKRILATEGVT
jgi:hypothetical protein